MVAYTLQQVAHKLFLEEPHGQAHYLDEEIADHGDVDAHGYMQQEPSAYESGEGRAEQYHQFAEHYEPYKTDVLIFDAGVDDGLRQEGEEKLQDAAQTEAEGYLYEVAAVAFHVSEQKAPG